MLMISIQIAELKSEAVALEFELNQMLLLLNNNNRYGIRIRLKAITN